MLDEVCDGYGDTNGLWIGGGVTSEINLSTGQGPWSQDVSIHHNDDGPCSNSLYCWGNYDVEYVQEGWVGITFGPVWVESYSGLVIHAPAPYAYSQPYIR